MKRERMKGKLGGVVKLECPILFPPLPPPLFFSLLRRCENKKCFNSFTRCPATVVSVPVFWSHKMANYSYVHATILLLISSLLRSLCRTHPAHNSSITSEEGLTFETPGWLTFYGGNLTVSNLLDTKLPAFNIKQAVSWFDNSIGRALRLLQRRIQDFSKEGLHH